MMEQPFLKGVGATQQILRWIIPACFAAITFFSLMEFDWRNIRWAQEETFYPYIMPLLSALFLLLALTCNSKGLRISAWIIVASYFIAFLFNWFGDDVSFFIRLKSSGWANVIQYAVFLGGVIVLCSGREIRNIAPRLSLLYIFMLAGMAVFPIHYDELWSLSHTMLYFVIWGFRSVFFVVSTAFWYRMLTDVRATHPESNTQSMRLSALGGSACVITISYLILNFFRPLL